MLSPYRSFRCALPIAGRRIIAGVCLLLALPAAQAADVDNGAARAFNLPAGSAEQTLRQFSEQGGVQVLYPTDSVGDVRTNAVQGSLTPADALQQLVSGTSLIMVRDDRTGALGVRRDSAASSIAAGPTRGVVEPAAAAAAGSATSSDSVELSPFSVNASKDEGFVAASSLAGGRIATALKDTPVAYSVVTAEFLEAFNISDVAEAAQWTVNSSVVDADGTNRAFAQSQANGSIRTRGVTTGQPTRNFFPFIGTADSYNLDRVDFARGPNAVLFGAGGVGGTVNSVTKMANLSRNFQEARVQLGSYQRYRFTADVNQVVTDKLGVRANVLWDQSNTWRDREWKDRYGVHLASTFKITRDLSIRGEAEYNKTREAKGTVSLRDRLSAWDGITTFSSIPTVLPTPEALAAAGIVRSGMRWVTHESFGGRVLNFENRYVTKGAAQSTTLGLTNQINGVPIRTAGFTLNNQAMIDDNAGVPADRYARAVAGSRFTIPDRERTTLWSNKLPTFSERTKDFSLVANYKLGSKIFLEAAGDLNEGFVDAQTGLARRGGQDIFVDIDSTLPGGGANPNFLRPFSEFMEYHNLRTNKMRSVRAQAVYVEDTRIGKLQFSGMVGQTRHRTISRAETLLLPLKSRAPDARSWVDNLEYSEYGVYTRFYFDQPNLNYRPSTAPVTLVDPVKGLTETVTPTWMFDTRREDNNRNSLRDYKFLQAAGNLDLLRNRLVLIGAFRRDFAKVADKRVLAPGDMPAGWDGTSLIFRKDAPADYFALTYFPKDANGNINGPLTPADVRPRSNVNGANIPQPQYANDRFRDDSDSPQLSPIINTYTVGGVVNATRWLGLYGNVSETFSLTAPSQKADGTLVPPTSSHGTDYGVRVTLPNGRMSMSIGSYNSYQEGAAVLAPAGFQGSYNSISDAPVVGDLSPVGRNVRNVNRFPQNVYSTVTSETKGYEFEVTANFTRAWRLVLNAGYTKARQKDQYPDIIDYFKSQDAVSRQILADAGVLIDANNDASINPALNSPTLINQTRVTAAVNGWNSLIDTVIPNTTAQIPQPTQGSSKWVGNIATDYRFSSGFLKGVRVGGGVNYRGGQVVGYRGSDTIINPANPLAAIDDPTVDSGTAVIAPSYYKGVASLSYTFRLKEGRSVQLDFNVDNLFDRRAPIYGSNGGVIGTNATNLRPRPGESIISPARITVPSNYSYLMPRNYTFSAKLAF